MKSAVKQIAVLSLLLASALLPGVLAAAPNSEPMQRQGEPRYVGPATISPAEILNALNISPDRARTPLNLTGMGATTDALILGCANNAGKNGAYFKTEVNILTRWTTRNIKVDMFAVPMGSSITSGDAVGGTYELTPFTIYTYSNILSKLGLSGPGYVLIGIDSSVTNRSNYTMDIWANTYTANPTGGYFRTPLPVFTDFSLLDTYYQYRFPNVMTTDGNRTNIGLFNPDTTRTLILDVFVSDYALSGWVGPTTVTLQAGEFRQVSLSTFFSGSLNQGEVRFDIRTRDIPRYVAYAVRTDNYSNDGLLELPYKCSYSGWPY
jgi:hypothetical protein